jgi:hypothetical protein
MMSRIRISLRVGLGMGLASVLMFIPVAAFAHEKVESGNYHYEIGWLNEPVVIGERNGLDLFVATKDKPDQGLGDIGTLKFTAVYAGATQDFDITPVEGEPGHYLAVFVPTRAGKYTFHLTGNINTDTVDVSVQPDEVQPAGSLDFPAAQAASQSGSSTSSVLPIIGLVFGVLGTALGAFALIGRRAA